GQARDAGRRGDRDADVRGDAGPQRAHRARAAAGARLTATRPAGERTGRTAERLRGMRRRSASPGADELRASVVLRVAVAAVLIALPVVVAVVGAVTGLVVVVVGLVV